MLRNRHAHTRNGRAAHKWQTSRCASRPVAKTNDRRWQVRCPSSTTTRSLRLSTKSPTCSESTTTNSSLASTTDGSRCFETCSCRTPASTSTSTWKAATTTSWSRSTSWSSSSRDKTSLTSATWTKPRTSRRWSKVSRPAFERLRRSSTRSWCAERTSAACCSDCRSATGRSGTRSLAPTRSMWLSDASETAAESDCLRESTAHWLGAWNRCFGTCDGEACLWCFGMWIQRQSTTERWRTQSTDYWQTDLSLFEVLQIREILEITN